MASIPTTLPPLAPFPQAAWRNHLVPAEWEACLDAWISISSAHLSLSASDFLRISLKDESLPVFLTSYAAETAKSHVDPPSTAISKTQQLRKHCFLLSYRLFDVDAVPGPLLHWEFLADLSKIYGQRHGSKITSSAWKRSSSSIENSLGLIKAFLTRDLEAGMKGDLSRAESTLKRLNHLLHASHEAATFLVAGSDFMDALISCYKLMNPPLRKAIISTTYLCLIGLTEGEKPKFSSLVDQLYSLKTAADTHKAGPTNANDSLVAELVTATPILKQVQERIDSSGSGSSRAKSVLTALEGFKKPGGTQRSVRILKRKLNSGKRVAKADDNSGQRSHVHVHRMSLVSQVQDLFPELGSGFVVKLLDAYNDNVEQVISHLLENSLPPTLQDADRSEELNMPSQPSGDLAPNLVPHSTPPQLPSRRNVFDDDEFDQLAIDTSHRSTAPAKAAILSALAAFDSDDDERDDTYVSKPFLCLASSFRCIEALKERLIISALPLYRRRDTNLLQDIEDVGGTVDSANPEEATADIRDGNDEPLFKAYTATPDVFGRDAATRRGNGRMKLKQETGMTDEAIEGWGLMLSRDTRQMKRLEAKFSTFAGGQNSLAPTSWKASPAGSGTEDSDVDGGNRGRGGLRGRGGRGRGRGRGNVAGPTGEKDTEVARHRKEANKGSRANHNRRDQRAKKMARGGFPG
ncbi:Activating signal cointegrator 1 complex subunit [Lachnellula occidentalis]|uniref:Activating signal cointegrator 1 complex subunit n=1 Tax=Lachnellula occidentalis TaxID=215460 RepID=A0A8H8RLK3_9HELO|nr:Activating signal cointegrator 1 complex subunit [Lachnellula occidentalis]